MYLDFPNRDKMLQAREFKLLEQPIVVEHEVSATARSNFHKSDRMPVTLATCASSNNDVGTNAFERHAGIDAITISSSAELRGNLAYGEGSSNALQTNWIPGVCGAS